MGTPQLYFPSDYGFSLASTSARFEPVILASNDGHITVRPPRQRQPLLGTHLSGKSEGSIICKNKSTEIWSQTLSGNSWWIQLKFMFWMFAVVYWRSSAALDLHCEVIGLNLIWDTEISCSFPQSLKADAGIVPWLGHDHLLPNPF
jgi:hypothetical protein